VSDQNSLAAAFQVRCPVVSDTCCSTYGRRPASA
jgi:hypothetical protein